MHLVKITKGAKFSHIDSIGTQQQRCRKHLYNHVLKMIISVWIMTTFSFLPCETFTGAEARLDYWHPHVTNWD